MKKAFFSTITGAFLIIVLVVAVLGFFLFQSLTLKSGSASEEQRDKFSAAKNFKDNLLICHAQTHLLESKLRGTDCDSILSVKGYQVKQEAFFDCDDYLIEKGKIEGEAVVYKVAVEQERDGKRCIARLIIYP